MQWTDTSLKVYLNRKKKHKIDNIKEPSKKKHTTKVKENSDDK